MGQVVALDAPAPAVKTDTRVVRADSGQSTMRIVVGCELRHHDMLTNKVSEIPNCQHVETNPDLRAFLEKLKAKAANGDRVLCSLCGREFGGRVVQTVWKHNGMQPNRPFPLYLDHYKALQVSRVFSNSAAVDGVVLIGRFFLDATLPFTRPFTAPTTEFIENVRGMLEKEGLLNQTFGVYYVGARS